MGKGRMVRRPREDPIGRGEKDIIRGTGQPHDIQVHGRDLWAQRNRMWNRVEREISWRVLDMRHNHSVVNYRAHLPVGIEGRRVVLFDHPESAGVKPRPSEDGRRRSDTPPLRGDACQVNLR